MPAIIATSTPDTNKATVMWNALGAVTNISASGSATDYPVVNLVDPGTATNWKASGSNGWAQYDFGAAVSIDSAGVAAHTLATSGVTGIAVQSSTDGTTWVSRITYAPLTNEDIVAVFPAVSARYWRLLLTGPAANVGIFAVGKRLVFPHAPVDSYTPLSHARTYTKMFNGSIRGQLISNRVMSSGAETDVDLGFVYRAFVDGDLMAFESHYNQGGIFFYASSPSTAPADVGYCRAAGDEESVAVEYIEAGKLASLSFSIHAYVGV